MVREHEKAMRMRRQCHTVYLIFFGGCSPKALLVPVRLGQCTGPEKLISNYIVVDMYLSSENEHMVGG